MAIAWQSVFEEKNLLFSRAVNTEGGEILLDNRIRRGGSHHQKIVVVRRETDPDDDIAFVGGMDLVHGRHDDGRHLGDPQRADLDSDDYGERPGWHDVQVALRGPAVDDVAFTFRERWEDPAPLDTRSPLRWLLHRFSRHPTERAPLAAERVDPSPVGPHAVQVLRTYPACRKPYPFAPDGERSIARAYIKAFGRARRLIYLEDQYLWSFHATRVLCDALRRERELLVVIVIPRYPDPDGRISGAASVLGANAFKTRSTRRAETGSRSTTSRGTTGRPSTCIPRRASWTTCGSPLALTTSTADHGPTTRDLKVPSSMRPATNADPLTRRPRRWCPQIRSRHAPSPGKRAHRRRAPLDEMIDPQDWFRVLRRSAERVDNWHRDGQRGPRPPGHLRGHVIERVNAAQHGFTYWVHTHILDPDGRPSKLKRDDTSLIR